MNDYVIPPVVCSRSWILDFSFVGETRISSRQPNKDIETSEMKNVKKELTKLACLLYFHILKFDFYGILKISR